MLLFYDFELSGIPVADTLKTSILLGELRHFVYQRLKILESEMAMHNGVVVINVMDTGAFANYPLSIINSGFPEQLRNKIVDSINSDDMQYIFDKIIIAFQEEGMQ